MKTLFVVILTVIFATTLVFAQDVAKPVAPAAEKKAEAPKAMPKTAMVGEIAVKTIPMFTAATVMEKAVTFAPKDGYAAGMEGVGVAYQLMMKDGYEKLGAWMKGGGKPAGPSFGLFFEDPSKTPAKDLTCKVGFPCEKSAKATDAVVVEDFPEMKAAVVQYSGPYDGSMEIWDGLYKWIGEHHFEFSGAPFEIYIVGPGDNTDPAKYMTEIRVPVKPAEMKTEEPKK
jgi:effector-binding domain-containing protein